MDPRDYHLQKIGEHGKIGVWLVDGEKVRREVDKNFTNFGHGYLFKYIPTDEFWIDQKVPEAERPAIVDKLLSERKLRDVIDACHLEKIGRRGKIAVWLVDGPRLRKEVDPEFVNFGEHFLFHYIPEYEFWIDKEAVPDERGYFITHLIEEWRLMRDGVPYPEAKVRAGAEEVEERRRHKLVAKLEDKPREVQREAIHGRLLGKTTEGVEVWIVDGKLVRGLYEINFTEGGHRFVYPFIPKNEVWLDNDLAAAERPFILLHELRERALMENGMTYDVAHARASRLEWRCRHEVNNIDECLAELGWSSKENSAAEK